MSQITKMLKKELNNKIERPVKKIEIEVECADAIIFTSAVKEINYLEQITEYQNQITKEITSQKKTSYQEEALINKYQKK